MAGYTAYNYILKGESQAVGADADEQVLTKEFVITDGDSKQMLIALVATSVTSTTGLTAKLQSRPSSDADWVDGSTVAITGDGTFTIVHNIADGSTAPLWPVGRVVITTGTDDAASIDEVLVTRRR